MTAIVNLIDVGMNSTKMSIESDVARNSMIDLNRLSFITMLIFNVMDKENGSLLKCSTGNLQKKNGRRMLNQLCTRCIGIFVVMLISLIFFSCFSAMTCGVRL